MERAEAEAIYEQGPEVVVRVLVELSAQNERLVGQVEQLTARVGRQEERIAQLERASKRSSRDSSQPPSQDPPSAPPRRGKDPSGRAQGAQPGHEGKGRPLLPAWAVNEVVEHWPDRCECGHVFCDAERVAAGEPARHQVEELPAMAVRVTEHRCQRVRCPDCGTRQTKALPAEVAPSAFGPRLQAAVVTLSVRNRPRTCSATVSRSSPQIAGGPTATCPSDDARCAGRICSATSPSMPKAWSTVPLDTADFGLSALCPPDTAPAVESLI